MAHRFWFLALWVLFLFLAIHTIADAEGVSESDNKATIDEDKVGKQGNIGEPNSEAFRERMRTFKERQRNPDDEERRRRAEEIFADARRTQGRDFDRDEDREYMEKHRAAREKRRAERREQMRGRDPGRGARERFDGRPGKKPMDFDPRDSRDDPGRRGRPRPPFDPHERRRQQRSHFDRQTRDEL